jgi:bifunctional non-homologous end joining protein LigD
MGLEGLVSKHRDRPYRGGRQTHWIKVKNRAAYFIGLEALVTQDE